MAGFELVFSLRACQGYIVILTVREDLKTKACIFTALGFYEKFEGGRVREMGRGGREGEGVVALKLSLVFNSFDFLKNNTYIFFYNKKGGCLRYTRAEASDQSLDRLGFMVINSASN